MSYPILDIEGIGPEVAARLKAVGIRTTAGLLEAAKSAKGRKRLAEQTGLEEKRLLKWANMADLMRIRGVGQEYAELLEAAGVDTLKELKHRNAYNLCKAMKAVNDDRRLCRLLPAESAVGRWIAHAKSLPVVISY
jgi:predicted flap endonuclease-1-like 5' DNA nuclease